MSGKMLEIQEALQTVPSIVCFPFWEETQRPQSKDALQVGGPLLGAGDLEAAREVPQRGASPATFPARRRRLGGEEGLCFSALSQKQSSPVPKMKQPNFPARGLFKVLSDPTRLLGLSQREVKSCLFPKITPPMLELG